jgi:RNA polymerase sigma-70 factor (ECF subfamily)
MVRGEEAAYREFYESYFGRLLRYLLVLTAGREAVAKDALQATMLRVIRHIRVFDSEPVFWSWLSVLARSALVDEQRKHGRYLGLLERLFQGRSTAAPADQPADARLLILLQDNLAALPEEDRGLVERKYFDREPVREIAQKTGCTEKAIESRLVRIRRQLKDMVLAQLKEDDEVRH